MSNLLENLNARFAHDIVWSREALGEVTIEVPREHILTICRALHDEPPFHFEQLIDLCGVDYLAYGDTEWSTETATEEGFSRGRLAAKDSRHQWHGKRFAVVYHLISYKNNIRLRVRSYVDEEMPIINSVVDIWNCANWFEREAFDLYGIIFEGHPDLRRILTDYGFIGYPMRKDFPLSGHVEVRYDEQKKRVVYEPVQIDTRILVPRVIRDDHRYLQPAETQPSSSGD